MPTRHPRDARPALPPRHSAGGVTTLPIAWSITVPHPPLLMRRPSTPPPFCLCAPCAQPGVYTVRPTLRIVYPPLQRIGIVHAKLMLLQTRTFLRVVVSSANLTAEDWELMDQVWPSMFASRSSRQRLIGIGRCVESWQILFVQDFPRRSTDAVGSSLDVPFAADLDAYLGALSAPDDIRGWLTMFDWRQARVRGRRCPHSRRAVGLPLPRPTVGPLTIPFS